jgi:hypothetical protein
VDFVAVPIFGAVRGIVVQGDGFFIAVSGTGEVAGVVLEGKFNVGTESKVAVFAPKTPNDGSA